MNTYDTTITTIAHELPTSNGIHISLAAEKIGTFLGVPITNTLLMSFVVFAILGILTFFVTRNLTLIPGRMQTLIETLFVGILDYMSETLEDEKLARKLFPLILTIFLFIFIANIIEFTPGIGSIGWSRPEGEFIPLLRSLNTDLNATLAITIIAFLAIEVAGVATLGVFQYGKKFVNLSSVLGFFVGIIELFSELARLVSFSFRLFGNIFAGEVVILVIQHFVPLVLPVPIMVFEVFVGFMQAAIFALLTLFFVKIAITEQAH